jgi:hypothetical protein
VIAMVPKTTRSYIACQLRTFKAGITYQKINWTYSQFVTVLEEEGNCIVCLEMRADELIRRLISGRSTD